MLLLLEGLFTGLIKKLLGSFSLYITEMLSLHRSSTLRSTETSQLIVPRFQKKHGKAAFSYYAKHSWNTLP